MALHAAIFFISAMAEILNVYGIRNTFATSSSSSSSYVTGGYSTTPVPSFYTSAGSSSSVSVPIDGCYFNGTQYQIGDIVRIGCARLRCYGYPWGLYYYGYDYYNCLSCKAYLDPHIVTYESEWRSYSYQRCGNYSLTQFGNSYTPQVAVYANFTHCGGSYYVTCVDYVTFKNDEHTIITLGYENNMLIHQVNGEDFNISPTGEIEVNGIIYPVLAWRTYSHYISCISLYGSSGLLVNFCGSNWANQVYMWPDQSIQHKLMGLCSNITQNRCNCFVWRDGYMECPWTRYPNEGFPLSWLASGNSSCGHDDARVKRQTSQNICEVNSTVEDHFRHRCASATVQLTSSGSEERETLINDCVFDLCNVDEPDDWLEAVEQTVEVLVLSEVNITNECESNDEWRGRCFGNWVELSGYSKCDAFITNNSGCAEGQTCCVDCSKLNDICHDKWDGSVAVYDPCPRCDRKMGEIRPGSGCSCCKRCRRADECKAANGRCVSDADPRWNTTWCMGKDRGVIHEEWCLGDGCKCCIWNKDRSSLDDDDDDE